MNQLVKKYIDLENKTFKGDYFSSNLDNNVIESYATKSS